MFLKIGIIDNQSLNIWEIKKFIICPGLILISNARKCISFQSVQTPRASGVL